MNLKRIRLDDIIEDALAIVLGIGILGGAALGGWLLMQHLGLGFSYTGLSRDEISRVVRRMDSSHDLLSRVTGKTYDGKTYTRGIYWDKGGIPIYYRYEYGGDDASMTLYPMNWNQVWSTSPFNLGHIDERLIFPDMQIDNNKESGQSYGYY